MSKITHMCLDVMGVLQNWKERDLAGMFRHSDGKKMTGKEVKIVLLNELAKGHKVLPLGKACEGFDYTGGGCPGHEEDH